MVDIQLPQRGTLSTVLALMRVPEHQVATRESHRDPRGSVIAKQVNDARHAERAPDNRNGVIVSAHWQLSPQLEVVGFTDIVEGKSDTAIEQHDGALHGGHLNGN
jgi:hypothetical protein